MAGKPEQFHVRILPPVSRRAGALLILVILAGILARSYRITDPLLEAHSLRQYDTAAIARNYYEGGMKLLYPQVDWRGNSPGYVASEFPIYCYAVAGMYRVWGVHEWLGRALNIALYGLSALLLFQLTRRLFNEGLGLLAVFFYTILPLSFLYTRTFQPDALMSFFCLAAVYFFVSWTETEHLPSFLLSALAASLAILIKPPSAYFGVPLVFLAHRHFGWGFLRRPLLWLYALAVIVPALLWYRHATNLWQEYGNSFFVVYLRLGYPGLSDPAWLGLARRLPQRFVFEVFTPAGVLLGLAGLFSRPWKENLFLHWWNAGFAVSIFIWPQGYWGHDYYQLPFIFAIAIWMALGAKSVWDSRKMPKGAAVAACTALCALVLGYSVWTLKNRFQGSDGNRIRVVFGEHVSRLTRPEELVIFLYPTVPGVPREFRQHRTTQGEYLSSVPEDFYLSHRKGFAVDEDVATPQFVETLRQRGARCLATYSPEIFAHNRALEYALAHSSLPSDIAPHWVIYRLSGPIEAPSATQLGP